VPVRAAALVGLLLAAPAAAETESLLPPTCEALLAQGEFNSRFRVIDPVARVTACRMKGAIEATLQTMPFVSEANCTENLERLLKLPEPRRAR
jgi:hypothetical protein